MLARIIRVNTRSIANLSRPAPPPLPRNQQREFEQLQRAPLAADRPEADLTLHPDARTPLTPDFEGDVNPLTGEQGGPKKEPVRSWGGESEGDWSFKGREPHKFTYLPHAHYVTFLA
ncbi:hypothetical protein DXG01_003860 [Tephrocybe rancida]|nr:hypothetical protein DXG01_003860 [Tephrocybe rancida]